MLGKVINHHYNNKGGIPSKWNTLFICIKDRSDLLHLNWVCYEDIIEKEFGIGKIDLTESNWETNKDILFVINEIKKLAKTL
ncbi:MAG TPA: hypothetical protein VFD33_00345 [Bacillota bacterium]|nr:hypothetical protein [Bacillota bacterium]